MIKITLWLVSARDLDGLIPAVNVAGVALWADVWLKLLKRAVMIYESFSDVGEIRVWFASKILTPCRMH